ncbi:ferritin [Desulfuribacillus stibiiarsenatis]|uniref:Ferritin n=1 Tax=Desulfuribacillus stibiiarsenatis TaxID=1390249 RepID=A0A1E5L310_9FIRM|nr:ferritin [Desulfuribacillus stibiiarsenatis]OEH84487.1 ferritin [Desulfuribacillus stibiiarsenatis]
MLSDKLVQALNKQMNFEFFSAHYYIAIAAYCDSIELEGFANYFLRQAEEEQFHAMKFYKYIKDMDGRVIIAGMDTPKNEYENVQDVFEVALSHEKEVTKRIYQIMDIAQDERQYATISLLNWYVDEQVEEEAAMSNLLSKIKKLQDNNLALYELDKELALRTFTPPLNA